MRRMTGQALSISPHLQAVDVLGRRVAAAARDGRAGVVQEALVGRDDHRQRWRRRRLHRRRVQPLHLGTDEYCLPRHGCHSTQETRVQNAFDNIASVASIIRNEHYPSVPTCSSAAICGYPRAVAISSAVCPELHVDAASVKSDSSTAATAGCERPATAACRAVNPALLGLAARAP